MKIYLVGGAVRDQLLNRPVKERDWVVVGATPEDMLGQGFKPVGKDFPVFLHPKTQEEYALARTERKSGRGYAGFVFNTDPSVTLEEDLMRRDLTVNAIAMDDDENIIDPYNGQDDLKARSLRHVSPAFVEDPVRILRVARFAARFKSLNFTVADETNTLMQAMVDNGEVDFLVPERVWQECEKALRETGTSDFFAVLAHCGALQALFPAWHAIYNQAYFKPILTAIDQTINPIQTFSLACLLLGKASHWQSSRMQASESLKIIDDLSMELKIPNKYTDLAKLTARWFYLIPRVKRLTASALLQLLLRCDVLRRGERFDVFLSVCHHYYRAIDQDYSAIFSYLTDAAKLLTTIDTKPLQAQGLKGLDFAKALYELRLSEIKCFMSHADPGCCE